VNAQDTVPGLRDDPEAPTTVKSGNGSFEYPRERGSSGIALPDEGSLVNPPNSGANLALTSPGTRVWSCKTAATCSIGWNLASNSLPDLKSADTQTITAAPFGFAGRNTSIVRARPSLRP
jgi:hypothetical protein